MDISTLSTELQRTILAERCMDLVRKCGVDIWDEFPPTLQILLELPIYRLKAMEKMLLEECRSPVRSPE